MRPQLKSPIEFNYQDYTLLIVDDNPIQQTEVLARVTTHLQIRNLTQSLQKANKELVELNATKDKFFSIVAHDGKSTRNPQAGDPD